MQGSSSSGDAAPSATVTPATARRKEALRQAAASHVALSGLLERPLSHTSADAVLGELELQLDGSRRGGGRSLDERLEANDDEATATDHHHPDDSPSTQGVHTISMAASMARKFSMDLSAMSDLGKRSTRARAADDSALPRSDAEREEAFDGKAALSRRVAALRQREIELEQQLADVTHAHRRVKEELTSSARAFQMKSATVERLEATAAAERDRAATLEQQLSGMRSERDHATRALANEAARREEAAAQLAHRERELGALRARADELERTTADATERARAAEQATATQRQRLEGRLAELDLALLGEASERAAADERANERTAALRVRASAHARVPPSRARLPLTAPRRMAPSCAMHSSQWRRLNARVNPSTLLASARSSSVLFSIC